MGGLYLSGLHDKAGTIKNMDSINDVDVGASVICVRSCGGASKDKEYTVTGVTGQQIDLEGHGRKCKVKPAEFLQSFERRSGPVVEKSFRRGLVMKAITGGDTYSRGDVVTLIEAEGRVFDFKNEQGQRGHVDKEDIQVCFVYV